MGNPKRLLYQPRWQEFSDRRKNTKQQVLGFVWVWSIYSWTCVCVCLCVFACVCVCVHSEALYSHLFENHELIQEVNTLAREEFPDGLLSLEALRVRGGAHLGRLVPQELCHRVVLQKRQQQRSDQTRRNQLLKKTLNAYFYHHPDTLKHECLFMYLCRVGLTGFCLEILVLAQLAGASL